MNGHSSQNQPPNHHSNTIRFAHKWIIENYSAFYNDNGWKPSFVYSDNFSPFAREHLDTYIELSPCREDDENRHFISLHLCIDGSYVHSELMVKYKLSLVDSNGEKFCCKESQNTLIDTGRFGWDKYIRSDHLLDPENEALPCDKLTVFCEIEISTEKYFPSQEFRYRSLKITRSYFDAKSRLSPFQHKWTVDNLEHFRNEEDVEHYPANSTLFSPASDNRLQFYIKMNALNERNVMRLCLFFKSTILEQVKIQFRFTIWNDKRKKCFVMGCQESLASAKGFGWYFPMEQHLNTCKNPNRLIILCEAQLFHDSVNTLTNRQNSYGINGNLGTALNAIYSFGRMFSREIKYSEDGCSSDEEESCSLLCSMPLTESYFNGAPKVLDSLVHTWSIHNYSDFLFNSTSRRHVVESDSFKSNRNGKLQFKLRLFPKGHTDVDNGFNSVYLVYSTVKRIDVTVQLVLGIIDEAGDRRYTKIMRHKFGANSNPFYSEDYLGFYFIRNDYLMNEGECLLSDDKLTIYCEVQAIDDRVPDSFDQDANDIARHVDGEDEDYEAGEGDPLL